MGDIANCGQIRFGVFELDPRTRELRRNGVLVKLQDQPFQVLLALVEKPGELVTREELEKRIWPDNTFVDFELGLSRAVNKLRDALGDTAENPRFVQTLPKRGYRFIAPVNGGGTIHLQDALAGKQTPRRRMWRWATFAGVLVAAMLVTGLWPIQVPRVQGIVWLTSDGQPKKWPLATDGQLVIFVRAKDFLAEELWQVPVEGGEPKKLRVPDEQSLRMMLGSYSPATRQVLLSAKPFLTSIFSDLWLVDMHGESPRNLGRQSAPRAIALAPDGKRLAFSTPDGIFVREIESGREQRIVQWKNVRAISWLPSGKQIGWLKTPETDRGQQDERAWVVDDDGQNNRRAVPEAEIPQTLGSWSPDGRDFYFTSDSELWLRRRAGLLGWMRDPAVQKLTASGIFRSAPYSLPSDTGRLYATVALRRGETVRYDLRSGQWSPLLPGLSADSVESSPDEKSILYVRYPQFDLWRSRTDGTEAVQLTTGIQVMSPKWSPDGRHIAFTARKSGAPEGWLTWRLYIIPAAGGEVRPVNEVNEPALICSWAPDGRLAFARAGREHEQFVIKILDRAKGTVETLPGSEGRMYPRWSPDGKTIMAGDRAHRVNLYDLKTGNWSVIEGVFLSPDWSKDSKWIHCGLGKMSERVRIDAATRRIQKLVTLNFDTTHNYFVWHGVAPNGDPITLRSGNTWEIVRVDLK